MAWIGVDFDGTLAKYDGWKGVGIYGAPVPAMVERVKKWLSNGKEVRIFTARANDSQEIQSINAWCQEYIGVVLPVTATKDYQMIELWDDRCVQVIPNTGIMATSVRDYR